MTKCLVYEDRLGLEQSIWKVRGKDIQVRLINPMKFVDGYINMLQGPREERIRVREDMKLKKTDLKSLTNEVREQGNKKAFTDEEPSSKSRNNKTERKR